MCLKMSVPKATSFGRTIRPRSRTRAQVAGASVGVDGHRAPRRLGPPGELDALAHAHLGHAPAVDDRELRLRHAVSSRIRAPRARPCGDSTVTGAVRSPWLCDAAGRTRAYFQAQVGCSKWATRVGRPWTRTSRIW